VELHVTLPKIKIPISIPGEALERDSDGMKHMAVSRNTMLHGQPVG
jgi:hypothetical protein